MSSPPNSNDQGRKSRWPRHYAVAPQPSAPEAHSATLDVLNERKFRNGARSMWPIGKYVLLVFLLSSLDWWFCSTTLISPLPDWYIYGMRMLGFIAGLPIAAMVFASPTRASRQKVGTGFWHKAMRQQRIRASRLIHK